MKSVEFLKGLKPNPETIEISPDRNPKLPEFR